MIVTIAGSPFTFYPDEEELAGINLEFAAFDGEVGNGQFPIPDPAAALSGVTGTQFKVVQDFTTLTNGFILDQDRTRGPFRVGSQRAYQFSVQDANAVLDGFRIIARHRDAETDVARVLAFAALDLPTLDTTWVINASTVTMPAKVYDSDGGWTSELIPDLLAMTGKTLFVVDKADGSGRELHYHTLTSGRTSGLSISDVVTEQDGITVYAPWEPERDRTSIDLRNDVLARDQTNRTALAQSATSIAAHNTAGIRHQQLLITDADSQADLQQQANAYLASYKDDLDTWPCSIGPLDGTALGKIRVGDLITTTSSVMGLVASPQRIAHMRLGVYGTNPNLWVAALELGAPIRRRARVRPSSVTNRIDHNPVAGFGGGDYCTDVPETQVTDTTEYHAADTVFIDGASVTMVPDNPLPTVTNAAILSDPTNGIVGNFPSFPMGSADVFLRGPAAAGQQVTVTIPISLPKWTTTDETPPAGIGAPLTPDWKFAFYADQGDPDAPYISVRIFGRVDHPPQTVQITLSGTIGGVSGSTQTFRTIAGLASADVPCTMTLTLDYDTSTTYLSFVPDSGGTPSALDYPVIPCTPMTTRVEGFAAMSGTYFTTGGTNANPPNVDSLSYSIITGTIEWCLTGAGPVAFHGQWYGPRQITTADGSTSTFDMPVYPGNGLFVGHVLGFVNGQAQPVTVVDASPPGTIDFGSNPADGDEIDATWLVP